MRRALCGSFVHFVTLLSRIKGHKGHEGYYRRMVGRKPLEEVDPGIPAKPARDIIAERNDMVS